MSIVMSSTNNGNSANGTATNGISTNGISMNANASYRSQPVTSPAVDPIPIAAPKNVKISWVAGKLPRHFNQLNSNLRFEQSNMPPVVGDYVLGKVTKIGNHSRLFTDDNQYSRIYQNDFVVGVLGSRYATDAYHATRIDPANLHMLTNGGLLGTVSDQHASMKNPTKIELMGYLIDANGSRINLKENLFRPAFDFPSDINPVFTVGTGMNSGKTTSTARLAHELVAMGQKVAVLKLTGSASHRDIHEFNATGAGFAADFSDYGFPSTYLTSLEELEGLYCRMMTDVAAISPDVVLIEIADGVYQRETEALLKSQLIQSTSAGIVLTAACAASAVAIDQAVKQIGWDPIAVTGLITNAPLFVQEFSARSETPVCDTGKGIQDTCRLIMSRVRTRKTASVPAGV